MCLAIYKPANTLPDWESYRNGHDGNDDSWGFAVAKDGQLIVERGLGEFEEFRREFEPYADCTAIIHFRLRSHGDVNLDNCHPFLITEELAIIHNGILNIDCDLNTSMSDTWHYVELVLKPMAEKDADFFDRDHMKYVGGSAIPHNKFVFLHADGRHAIWNEDTGIWTEDGHWYSNSGYRYSRFYDRRIGYTWSFTDTPKKCDDPCRLAASSPAGQRTLWSKNDEFMQDEDEREYECVEDTDAYNDIRILDLMQYGLSRKCLEEVFEVLGHGGIEALHDAM